MDTIQGARNGASQKVPHDYDAECVVFGTLASEAQLGRDPFNENPELYIPSTCFHDVRLRAFYEAALTLHADSRLPTPDEIYGRLADEYKGIAERKFLSELPCEVPAKAVKNALARLHDQNVRRALLVANGDPRKAREALSLYDEFTESKPGGHSPWAKLVEDGADIIELELPPVIEIITNLLTDRAKFVIGSGSKSFKTWLTIDAALSVSHNVAFLGLSTSRRKVLYVNLELKPSTFQRRVQIVAKAKGIKIDRAWFYHLPLRGQIAGLSVAQIIERIISIARAVGAQVVVLDPQYKLNVEGEENNSRDQTLLLNQIDRLTTEAEAAVMLNDHFGKGNQSEKDPLDTLRGSSAKGGDIDAAMILRPLKVDKCFRVDVIHRELPPVEPFSIGWEFPLMVVRPDLDPQEMREARGGREKEYEPAELLSAIADTTPQNPISILKWAGKLNIARTTLSDYAGRFRSKGYIRTIGEGKTARQYITEEGKELCRK